MEIKIDTEKTVEQIVNQMSEMALKLVLRDAFLGFCTTIMDHHDVVRDAEIKKRINKI